MRITPSDIKKPFAISTRYVRYVIWLTYYKKDYLNSVVKFFFNMFFFFLINKKITFQVLNLVKNGV